MAVLFHSYVTWFIVLLKIEVSHLRMKAFSKAAWHLCWWADTTVGGELCTEWGGTSVRICDSRDNSEPLYAPQSQICVH